MENTEGNERENEEFNLCPDCLRRLEQSRHRYQYLIGKWGGSVKAKNTRTGEFVKLDEVRRYMNE